ncbi:MAG: hypothetical protein MRQ11_02215 [Candidatus Midichloria mitochondrii]|uniref:hypothetical protein n=1 Tax=Candidatus Midichloria mitochondrii TaxID=234827 RepID=UPI0011D20834|nr:hypothetical protein [Candidatus Midichloria mitochondrii]MDJ1256217.1 hypothetical protein [Candidatus Midichloria mitochondrii]MDJ1288127.1 hypothetical protein [Candidatus Midichloria mitochondrii]MDJ1298992.1 hypothetical protein [Candidatus Midichloria mitochondrii]MDJ1312955.1 hypothetical protein [Candidatus Midichloria mitochondrii]MDJ1583503.1 hypothetical protein [Candidatus Midichloria mitochondrii]
MNCIKLFILLGTVFLMTACAPGDPSVNDLRSPCVSIEFGESSSYPGPIPCVRRSPIGNQFV